MLSKGSIAYEQKACWNTKRDAHQNWVQVLHDERFNNDSNFFFFFSNNWKVMHLWTGAASLSSSQLWWRLWISAQKFVKISHLLCLVLLKLFSSHAFWQKIGGEWNMGAFLDIPKGLITKEGSDYSKVNIAGGWVEKRPDHFCLLNFSEYRSCIKKGICSKSWTLFK